MTVPANAEPSALTGGDAPPPLVFLVAGEPSGDILAGRLMAALKARTGGRIRFAGVGGAAMRREGLDSLFPMRELSLMGLSEILPHLPRLYRRLRETVAAVRRLRPDAVVTVDSPEFSLRVARRAHATGTPTIQYVAPQLWAWRQGRGRRLAGTLDRLLALLPFEPEFFGGFGVPCVFVGHPVLESGAERGDAAAFRTRHGLEPATPLVTVLPGSRSTEVRRLLPTFGAALAQLAETHPGLTAAVCAAAPMAETVRAALSEWRVPSLLITDEGEKYDAFAASGAAITKSGTVTLELALAQLPMVVTYRVSPISAFLARRLIKVPYVSLVNLLAQRSLVPELLQHDCTSERIAREVAALLDDQTARAAQRNGFAEVIDRLGGLTPPPSVRAADAVLELIAEHRAAR